MSKNVNIEQLATIMRDKDQYGNDQLNGQQVGTSLRLVGIIMDREIMGRWMRAADINGKGLYSISVLLHILKKSFKKLDEQENIRKEGFTFHTEYSA